MFPRAIEPPLDLFALLVEDCPYNLLGSLAIGVSRGAGDVVFPGQTLAQILVGLADVLA